MSEMRSNFPRFLISAVSASVLSVAMVSFGYLNGSKTTLNYTNNQNAQPYRSISPVRYNLTSAGPFNLVTSSEEPPAFWFGQFECNSLTTSDGVVSPVEGNNYTLQGVEASFSTKDAIFLDDCVVGEEPQPPIDAFQPDDQPYQTLSVQGSGQ